MYGKIVWHPSRWPWVIKLPKRDRIYLVPTIKWEPLIQSLQNLIGIPPCHAFDLIKFWRKSETIFSDFFRKFQIRYSPVEYSICHILGMIGLIDVKQTEMSQLDATLTRVPFDLDLWRWIFKVKLHLGNGRPDCHRTKGTRVDRIIWCETQPLCDLKAEDDTVRDRGDLRCRRFRRLV